MLVNGNASHIVEDRTEFRNGGFVDGVDACTVCRMIRKHGVDVYAEAPDYLHIDVLKNFNSVLFREQAGAMGTIAHISSTEVHEQIG